MAGPWEKYQKTDKWTKEKSSESFGSLIERYSSAAVSEEEGPWSKYRKPRLTESMAKGAFSGLAQAAGAPTSGINWILQQLGNGVEEPFGGSTSLRRGLQSVGHGYTEEDFEEVVPELHRPFARGMETIGEAAPYIAAPYAFPVRGATTAIVAGKNIPLLTSGTTQAPAMLKPAGLVSAIIQSAKTNPQQYLTVESLLAGGSGIGAGIMEYLAPGDSTMRFLGELGGGLMPTTWVARSSGLLSKQIRNIRAKLTEEGQLDAAAEMLQAELKHYQGGDDFNEAVNIAIRNLDKEQLPGEYVFTGELTQHPVLIAIQNRIVKDNPQLDQKLREAISQTNNALKTAFHEAYKGGNKDIIRELGFWQQRFLLDTLAQTAEIAVKKAKDTAKKVRTARPKEAISKNLRKTLENSYRWGRAGERLVWKAVPNDVEAANPDDLQPFVETYDNLINQGTIGLEDVPPYVRRILQRIKRFSDEFTERQAAEAAREQAPDLAGEAEAFMARRAAEQAGEVVEGVIPEVITSGDLKILRNQLLRFARATRDSPKNVSFGMNELAGSLLDVFERMDLGEPVADAIAYSKQFNNLFTRGEVGDLLGYTSKGDVKVQPGLTGEKALAPGGTKAALASKAMERAAQLQKLPPKGRGQPLTGQEISRSSLRTKTRTTMREQEDFLKAAIEGLDPDNIGTISAEALKSFKTKHAETLRLFPRFRRELNDAKTAQIALERLKKERDSIQRDIEVKSLFAKISGYQDGAEAVGKAIFKSKTPTESYQELITTALSYPNQKAALDGLREATMEWIFRNSMRDDMLSVKDINDLLRLKPDAKTPDLLTLMSKNGILNAEQRKNLIIVLDRMEEIEKARDVSTYLGLEVDNPGMIEDLLARLIGANLAGSSVVAANTGSSLLMAAAGSRYMRKIMNELPMETMYKIITRAITTDKELLKLLLKRQVTPKDYNMLERKLEAWLLSAGTRYITEEEKKPTPEARQRPGFAEPVYHEGGMVRDYGKIAANLEKMPDISRKKHLTNMFKKNRKEFDRLFEYLNGNS